ncbi:DinB family protein [Halomonas ramblicola]|uniref:DinB family protein n=1 Tax=Halomonas ramblicola TaxID=747349 RepID=UPI0025B5862C|nr:DinB family protein [Halomonas ramblicola]MDN3521740.1 DinB family protein [Halomonas ramblicola]
MSYPSPEASPELAALVDENRQALCQLRDLLAGLSSSAYGRACGTLGRHSIGRHVRHILDHYESLLSAEAAVLDYEHRRRDPGLERSPARAIRRLDAIVVALADLVEGAASAHVRLHYPLGGGDAQALPTSLGRELAFLTSHTIHHMAILGLLAERLGVALPDDFGVHPSTLRHWQRQAEAPPVRSA